MNKDRANRPIGLTGRLSVMMFLQFFIWGAWYLSVSMYMYRHGMGGVRYYAYTAGPLAAIIAPFLTGMIADRFFHTERILAVLFALAGGFMLLLPYIGGLEGVGVAFQNSGGRQIAVAETIVLLGVAVSKGNAFNALILAHMLCFMPTLGLTASLAFRHLQSGEQQFPLVRLWGTLGWIVAGFLLAFGFTRNVGGTQIEAGTRAVQFYLGGGAALLLGGYCLTLPRTPPLKKGQPVNVRDLLFLDAWGQFRQRSFAVFMACCFLICIPLAAYYASLQQQMLAMEMTHITAWKNVGTFFEAAMLFAMPFFFRRLGIKRVLAMGILAWVARYAFFAMGATPAFMSPATGVWLVVLGIALHGLCYDFLFVAGQVYVDESTAPDIRAQCQSMNIFFTQGIGMMVGTVVAGKLAARAFGDLDSTSPAALAHWPGLWWPLCAMAALVLVVFLVAFRPARQRDSMAAAACP